MKKILIYIALLISVICLTSCNNKGNLTKSEYENDLNNQINIYNGHPINVDNLGLLNLDQLLKNIDTNNNCIVNFAETFDNVYYVGYLPKSMQTLIENTKIEEQDTYYDQYYTGYNHNIDRLYKHLFQGTLAYDEVHISWYETNNKNDIKKEQNKEFLVIVLKGINVYFTSNNETKTKKFFIEDSEFYPDYNNKKHYNELNKVLQNKAYYLCQSYTNFIEIKKFQNLLTSLAYESTIATYIDNELYINACQETTYEDKNLLSCCKYKIINNDYYYRFDDLQNIKK